MIRYALACDEGHGFDAWFGSSQAYDEQAESRAIVCPTCGSAAVHKAPMAPNLVKGAPAPKEKARKPGTRADRPASPKGEAKQTYALLREMRSYLETHAEDVGRDFPEEARKMHFGETEARSIYGKATADEARELVEDGIAVCPLPRFPEDNH
jgi:hypothetical protein